MLTDKNNSSSAHTANPAQQHLLYIFSPSILSPVVTSPSLKTAHTHFFSPSIVWLLHHLSFVPMQPCVFWNSTWRHVLAPTQAQRLQILTFSCGCHLVCQLGTIMQTTQLLINLQKVTWHAQEEEAFRPLSEKFQVDECPVLSLVWQGEISGTRFLFWMNLNIQSWM